MNNCAGSCSLFLLLLNLAPLSGEQPVSEHTTKKIGIVDMAATTAGFIGGYYGTKVAGFLAHELGHATAGFFSGLGLPIKFQVGLRGGKCEFKKPSYMSEAEWPKKLPLRKSVPTIIAGPLAGLYFNYLSLAALSKENENFENVNQIPGCKIGIQVAAGMGVANEMANLIPFTTVRGSISDGLHLLNAITARLTNKRTTKVTGRAYLATTIFGTLAAAAWASKQLYHEWQPNNQ
jgi:hypothetical protein